MSSEDSISEVIVAFIHYTIDTTRDYILRSEIVATAFVFIIKVLYSIFPNVVLRFLCGRMKISELEKEGFEGLR